MYRVPLLQGHFPTVALQLLRGKEGRKHTTNSSKLQMIRSYLGRLCFLATYTEFVKIDTLVLPVPIFIHTGSYGMTSYGPLRLVNVRGQSQNRSRRKSKQLPHRVHPISGDCGEESRDERLQGSQCLFAMNDFAMSGHPTTYIAATQVDIPS